MNTRIRNCEKCGGTIGPTFYIVKVAQALVDYNAVQRHTGLTMMMGGSGALADVFSPDRTMEKIVHGEDANKWPEMVLCQECFMADDIAVQIFEKGAGNGS